MTRHPKLVAVITGASSGIGRATAEEFASRGYAVVVLARRKKLLDSLVESLLERHPTGRFLALQCDISDWKQVSDSATLVKQELAHVNVLVNNAGAYEYQSLEKTTPEKLDEMINVNLRGVIYTTKAFLPLPKASKHKHQPAKIVSVSSIGGLWGFPNMSVYTATKFAVTGFTSALRRELAGEGIDVASIHPGPVRNKETDKPLPKRSLIMLPPQIAKQIFQLASSEKGRYISHPAFSVLSVVEYFSPRLVDRLLKKIL